MATLDFDAIKAAALTGEAQEQFRLGNAYHLGLSGAPRDLAQAQRWYEAAAAQGHVDANLNLGLLQFQDLPNAGGARNSANALHYFELAAAKGDAYAMFLAGEVLYRGDGIGKNIAKAIDWYVKSARAGNGYALKRLGLMALKGDDVPKNLAKAVDCFRRGAAIGHADCQYNLAGCYLDGEGVARDMPMAYQWMAKAAEQGHATAQYNLGAMQKQGATGAPDASAAVTWWEKAAAQDEPNALYALAQCYRKGDGVLPDEVTAFSLYQRAADLEHMEATFSLALMIEHGILRQPGDPAVAARWYSQAAHRGHAGAAHNLGILLARGNGVAQEADTAQALFEYAIGCGEDSALFSLGLLLYRGGPGLAPDLVEACKWALLSLHRRPEDGAQKLLDALGPHLTAAQIAAAEDLAANWQRRSTPLAWVSQRR